MDAADFLKRFKDKRILVVGDVMLDEFMEGTVSRISPEAPVPVIDILSRSIHPGGAANTANNLRSFDAKVHIAGVIGADERGRLLAKILERNGIDTCGLVTDAGRPTTIKTRILAGRQQIARIDEEKRDEISEDTTGKIIAFASKTIPSIDAIVISDYGKGVINAKLLGELISLAREHGKPVVADPKMSDYASYRGVTVVAPSRHEISNATGIRLINETSLRNAALKTINQLECDAVLVNLEREGLCLFEKSGEVTRMPRLSDGLYDVMGVTDSIVSVLTLALTAGAPMKEACMLAHCAATIISGKTGSSTVSIEEIRESLLIYRDKQSK